MVASKEPKLLKVSNVFLKFHHSNVGKDSIALAHVNLTFFYVVDGVEIDDNEEDVAVVVVVVVVVV